VTHIDDVGDDVREGASSDRSVRAVCGRNLSGFVGPDRVALLRNEIEILRQQRRRRHRVEGHVADALLGGAAGGHGHQDGHHGAHGQRSRTEDDGHFSVCLFVLLAGAEVMLLASAHLLFILGLTTWDACGHESGQQAARVGIGHFFRPLRSLCYSRVCGFGRRRKIRKCAQMCLFLFCFVTLLWFRSTTKG